MAAMGYNAGVAARIDDSAEGLDTTARAQRYMDLDEIPSDATASRLGDQPATNLAIGRFMN